jgi:chromosomal replication initiator protein
LIQRLRFSALGVRAWGTQEVTRHDTEIVAALHRALAGEVGAERFAVWFGRGVRMEPRGKKLRIAAADTRLQCIRKFFHAALVAVATGVGLELEFVVDPCVAADIVSQDAFHAVRSAPAAEPRPAILPAAQRLAQKEPQTRPQPPQPRPEFASPADFIAGEANLMAFTAAQTAAARPGSYTPLTFVGPPGCGKTHLLEGIYRHIRAGRVVPRVVYLTGEQFTNWFVDAVRHSGMPSFRHKVREADFLLIDDIDYVLGKSSTLQEAITTIDAFARSGRQIVLAMDRPLSELRAAGPELATRLAAGLVCELAAADFTVRQGILRRLAQRQKVSVPADVIDWIAAHMGGDTRELSGAINTLKAESEAHGRPIDLALAEERLADRILASRPHVRLPDIVHAVCDCLEVEQSELQSASKANHVTMPRMLVMFLARKWTRAALSEISRSVGRKSHSTVLSAEQKVTQWLANGKTLPVARGQWRVEDAIKRIEGQLRLA